MELTYGNNQAMIELVKKIAHREGIGNILAEGTMRAAAAIGNGAEAYAMHVKGMELSGYEPRGAKSQGFNYATANIGASHCYGFARQEIFGVTVPRPVDRFAEEENADIVIYNQHRVATAETGIVCSFAAGWPWYQPLFAKMLHAATGVDRLADADYLGEVGERIINLERAFNVREGFNRKQDTLPQRILTEPLMTRGAPGEGQIVRHQEQFLDRYYQLRRWSSEGIPTAEKLRELNLGYVLADIS
ncbi:aldehyde ferredoxin oxidoreductase C-terminal domain-containing protein [Chloroflexota bacterium]